MLARLRKYASSVNHTDDERKDAAIFHRTLNGSANIIATQRSTAAFQMALAARITSDPAELQRYIRVTMPDAPLTKALPAPGK